MPRYFFHLSFGQRVARDEEGFELPSRSAARDEALAVVRDLADPQIGGNPRRWASWFLEVADDRGVFFRTPIGHPALEIVKPDTDEPRAEEPTPTPAWPAATDFFPEEAAARSRTAGLVLQIHLFKRAAPPPARRR